MCSKTWPYLNKSSQSVVHYQVQKLPHQLAVFGSQWYTAYRVSIIPGSSPWFVPRQTELAKIMSECAGSFLELRDSLRASIRWREHLLLNPIGSMYGIFTYIYHKNQPNVGKCTSPMDPVGMKPALPSNKRPERCLFIEIPKPEHVPSLKLTVRTYGWNTRFLLGWPNFRCYVSFREGNSPAGVSIAS